MAFTIISGTLANVVAEPVQQYCIQRFGRSGLKLETGISPAISWSPTIQIKRSSAELLAIEVSEDLYPLILKLVAHDIRQDCPDIPITVYVATPLDSFLADNRQVTVRKLKEHGFGLFTVDQNGLVTEQFGAIPLIHHIPHNEFNEHLQSLPQGVRVKYKDAYDVYRANSYQGLQEVGQLIEGLVFSMAKQCHKKGWIPSRPLRGMAAEVLDAMYESTINDLKNQRASLGSARSFIKYYRNMASHAPKSIKEAALRIKACKKGFLDSLETASRLCEAHRDLGFQIKLYFP